MRKLAAGRARPAVYFPNGHMNSLVTNWKTTVAGLLALAASLAPVWAPSNIAAKLQASAAIFAASGLIASKDHDQ
jgi:hypothetical protein